MTTINRQVAATLDNAYAYAATYDAASPTSSGTASLFFVLGKAVDCHRIGFRFTDIAIPKNRTIRAAKLQLRSLGNVSVADVNVSIRAEAADDAADFTTSDHVWTRTRGAQSVAWDPGAWTAGTWYDSPDITAVIQEVVNRDGWTSGNDLVVYIDATAISVSYRQCAAYDSGAANAAKLIVDYADVYNQTVTANTEVSADTTTRKAVVYNQTVTASVGADAGVSKIASKPKTVTAGAKVSVSVMTGKIPYVRRMALYSGSTLVGYLAAKDGVKGAEISTELNGVSTLKFQLPADSLKWALLADATLKIIVDDMEFVLLNPIEEARDGSLMGSVEMSESQALLARIHPTVGSVDYAITILSDEAGEGGYDAGSAGSALYRLLDGTDWSVGTVDVSGTHDLEKEKIHLLDAIFEVRKLWGGWLVFDSVNKTVSLRDNALWVVDNGFELRHEKNEKTLKKITDYAGLITRIIPFGEKDLNIGSVNGGVLYLEDYTYCADLREIIWQREDIADPTELKAAAQAYLDQYCRPRVQYQGNMIDLHTLSGYEQDTFSLGDIVTIQDEDLADAVKVRLIGHTYDVFQPWKCSIKLGDPMKAWNEDTANAIIGGQFTSDSLMPSTAINNIRKGLQTWQMGSTDSVDYNYGLELNVYLPSTTVSVLTALLRFKLLKFRAYSKAAASGGGETVSISAASSDSAGMEYYSKYSHTHVETGGTTKPTFPVIDVSSHKHGIPHSHTISSHSHGITYGIYESVLSATGVTVTINGTDRTAALGGSFTTDQSGLEIKDYLVAGQWNTIVLGSTQLGRIDASVFVQALIT